MPDCRLRVRSSRPRLATRRDSCLVFDNHPARVLHVDERRSKGGRPSKGDRMQVGARLPRALAEALREEAERRGVSYSDVMAAALADRYGHAPVLPVESCVMKTEQMKLTA